MCDGNRLSPREERIRAELARIQHDFKRRATEPFIWATCIGAALMYLVFGLPELGSHPFFDTFDAIVRVLQAAVALLVGLAFVTPIIGILIDFIFFRRRRALLAKQYREYSKRPELVGLNLPDTLEHPFTVWRQRARTLQSGAKEGRI